MEADVEAQGRGFLACSHQLINQSGYLASYKSTSLVPIFPFRSKLSVRFC